MDLTAFTPALLSRPPGSPPETLAEYRSAGGYAGLRRALASAPEEILREVDEAELRGRGGAAFPTGRKWDLARRAGGEARHVVANGGEHEPGSRKDRTLVSLHPHKVLEGMAIGAVVTGASHGWLYLLADMEDALRAAEQAIAEARGAGLLGERILGSPFSFDVRLVRAPASYVAGEETAALEVIEGRPALPRKKPPYPGEKGIHGQPTTVNNVETLAHVPGILQNGAAWFRALGAPGSGGTMLFTLDPGVRRPGVVELPLAATFRDLVEGRGGGLRDGRRLRAILPAMSSPFLAASSLDCRLDHRSVREAGSHLGCGGVSLIAEGDCVVERLLAIARFFRDEQCGQCPPCRMETSTIAAVLERVATGEAGDYRAQIEKIAGFTAGKGACSLIEMAAAPVLSALRLFPEDFRAHAETGRCDRA